MGQFWATIKIVNFCLAFCFVFFARSLILSINISSLPSQIIYVYPQAKHAIAMIIGMYGKWLKPIAWAYCAAHIKFKSLWDLWWCNTQNNTFNLGIQSNLYANSERMKKRVINQIITYTHSVFSTCVHAFVFFIMSLNQYDVHIDAIMDEHWRWDVPISHHTIITNQYR